MTKQEAIKELEYLSSCSYVDEFEPTEKEALKMAIKELKSKRCDGCVREDSRELEEICNYCCRCKGDKYESYSPCDDCEHEGSFGKEFDDTCMQCKSGSNRTESR